MNHRRNVLREIEFRKSRLPALEMGGDVKPAARQLAAAADHETEFQLMAVRSWDMEGTAPADGQSMIDDKADGVGTHRMRVCGHVEIRAVQQYLNVHRVARA